MAIFLDASAVLAAADRADLNHAAAVAWFKRADEPLLLGALALGDLDALLQRELGAPAALALVRSITTGAIPVTIALMPWKLGWMRSPSNRRASPATPARKKG